MRAFGAIVLSEAPIVRAGEAQLPDSRTVGAQLVGDQQLRCEALFLEQLAHDHIVITNIINVINVYSDGLFKIMIL